jgi:hypothetical protein
METEKTLRTAMITNCCTHYSIILSFLLTIKSIIAQSYSQQQLNKQQLPLESNEESLQPQDNRVEGSHYRQHHSQQKMETKLYATYSKPLSSKNLSMLALPFPLLAAISSTLS